MYQSRSQEEIEGTLKLEYVEEVSLTKEIITKKGGEYKEPHRLVQNME